MMVQAQDDKEVAGDGDADGDEDDAGDEDVEGIRIFNVS